MSNSFLGERFAGDRIFNFIFCCFLVCVVAAIVMEEYFLMVLPIGLLLSFFIIKDLKAAYFIMILSIPLSMELYIGSLSVDAPDELFNILLFFLLPGFLFFNYKKLDLSIVRHPISLILLLMFAISIISTIFSVNPVLSIKYLLAKAWYIIGYFGFTVYFIKNWKDAKNIAIAFTITCTLTLIYVMIRHSASGFSFSEINFCVGPFYSNHVNYAVQLLVVFPFIWMLYRFSKIELKPNFFYVLLLILFVVGIYFSYTRAAIGALILLVPFYFVIRWRLAKPAIFASLIGVLFYGIYLVKDNKFFEYAPDYNKAISHQDFDKLLTATYNLEDISTMERVYRWVAARYMIAEKPLLGFGPNNFYDTYKSYTLRSFSTYVSDNPDKSTVHSYFLLLAIEQGVFAALLFIFLVCYALIIGERLYHNEKSPHNKYIVMAAMMCIFAIIIILSINDVIESDKEGSFFYISLGLITGFHWRFIKKNINQNNQPADQSLNLPSA